MAFVVVNLIQSAFSGFCPAENFLGERGIAKDSALCCGKAGEKMPRVVAVVSRQTPSGKCRDLILAPCPARYALRIAR